MADNNYLVRNSNLTDHAQDSSLESFFNGYVAHGSNIKDPYVSGYAFIKWIKVPPWIGDNNGADFIQLSERNFKGFGGLGDLQLDVGAITAGFTGNELSFAKGTVQKAEGFTLKYQVRSGSDIDRYYNRWVSGIRDPKTGIATYPKTHNIPYHSNNHTGILLYVVTRPDADNFGVGGDKSNIEFAALYTHVLPTKIMLGHFNYEAGSHENTENEQEFKGYMNIGEAVEQFAIDQMSTSKIYQFYNESGFTNLGEYATSVPDA